MYLPESAQQLSSSRALELLTEASDGNPEESCQNTPEIKEAFDQSLRQLAEDIVEFHPGLAHLLASLGDAPAPFMHGQN